MTLQQDSSHPTGISDDTPRGNSEVARARTRKARAALQLRRDGYTWDLIAESLGYPTARAALVATELALESELNTGESAEFMRRMAGDRLDRMLRGVWKKATEPENPEHLAAVDRARLLIEQHTRLFGYEAPKKASDKNATEAALEAWVGRMIQMQMPALEEANIFDAEVIEEEESQ